MKIEHDLPIKPISVNKAWQGRRFKTAEYKKWRRDILKIMPKEEKIEGMVRVEIILWLKSLLRGDIDNPVKPILDAIVEKGWIHDDRYIQSLEVSKVKQKEESISILIEELNH